METPTLCYQARVVAVVTDLAAAVALTPEACDSLHTKYDAALRFTHTLLPHLFSTLTIDLDCLAHV